jgi:diguanylate cyclase (GGDEF)-like protein
MDENVGRKSVLGQRQLHSGPGDWIDAQRSLAASLGLSILLVEGHQPPALAIANNNSICREFQTSETHAHLCEPFCGVAYSRAMKAGEAVPYRCHAGLHCITMPVAIDKKKKLAVIGGRAFLSTADYREFAERTRTGDLQGVLGTSLFENVIFAATRDLNELVNRVSNLASEYQNQLTGTWQTHVRDTPKIHPPQKARSRSKTPSKGAEPEVDAIYDACEAAIRALTDKYHLKSLALLLRRDDALVPTFVTGRFDSQPLLLNVELSSNLHEVARHCEPILMVETGTGVEMAPHVNGAQRGSVRDGIELFPLIVENDIKGVLLIADTVLSAENRAVLTKFCNDLALPLEVLRLRDELAKRAHYASSLQSFTYGIDPSDATGTYSSILSQSTAMLRARRSSLLLYDEASNELSVKAALGPHAKAVSTERVRLGHGVSGEVMLHGQPLIVHDMETSGREAAPAERRYKTRSFISYPISIRGRKLGVLNVTDKIDGSPYDESDLGLIEALAPQMALALDRADWQEKAAQFQLISITDPLTGLLNRRYLEERLAEELKRSERQSYSMGFLMIDIDDFKYYNDQNGHQAGDLALEMTAQCLKSVLRAADVASRYGGEEFCILLPQTTLDEAATIAERIRQRVEGTRVPHGKSQPLGVVTVSIGVSAFNEALQTPAAIIGAADRALYTAKRLGKNRVEVLDTDDPDLNNSNANERAN